MRLSYASVLFALAVLLVACGGGGGASALVPPHSLPTNAGTSRSAQAAIRLYVPPASAQNPASKHRLYITASTQSFEVWALPAQQTPSPATGQIFPVATPSPCAAASGGGLSCSLVVTAPIGTDAFYVAAYATANPSANAVPLSMFGPATVTVGASPNPSASPLSFSLDAVPASIAIAVASPDPGNTPNTQVFTIGAANSAPLAIAIKDASGNTILPDPTTQFASPILISVSPANAGIGLVLNSACSGAPAGSVRRRAGAALGPASSIVQLTCAADVGNVSVSYDGSIDVDSSHTILDAATISATAPFVSPAPSPGYIALQSGMMSTPIPLPAGFSAFSEALVPTGNTFAYVISDNSSATYIGTYNPSTNSASTPQALAGVTYGTSPVVASDGSFYLFDFANTSIDCWSSIANAMNPQTTGPAQIISVPTPLPNDSLTIKALAADGADNIWYAASDSNLGDTYAGSFPAGNCAQPASVAMPALLTGDTYDYSSLLIGLANGVAYGTQSNGVYIVTGAGAVTHIAALAGTTSQTGGIASDGAANIYADYHGGTVADIENVTRDTTIADAYPTTPVNGATPMPGILAAFPTTASAADRLAYGDNSFDIMGLLSNITSTPSLVLASVPNGGPFSGMAYAQNGIAYGLYTTPFFGAMIAAPLVTNTWNVPVTTVTIPCGGNGVATIVERGDSGPFTWTVPSGVSVTPFPGDDHAVLVSLPALGTGYPVTITDRNGRTRSFTLTGQNGCGG
jgi:hypothetical protein